MKKAINQWSLGEGRTFEQMLETAKKAGFTAFEPALSETGELSLESSDEQVVALKELAQKHGVTLTSLATGLYWKFSLTSDDEAMREKAKAIVRRQLECAKLLGVPAILVVPALVGSVGAGSGVHYALAYERALSGLKDLAPYAQELGVVIGVENVWNNFLLSPIEARDFIDAVGSPFVQFYLDVGNIVKYGYPEQWVDILAERICCIHVKDYKREAGTLAGFVDLLSGSVDFPKVIDALKKVGFDGYITAEMSTDALYPDDILRRTSSALDVILEG